MGIRAWISPFPPGCAGPYPLYVRAQLNPADVVTAHERRVKASGKSHHRSQRIAVTRNRGFASAVACNASGGRRQMPIRALSQTFRPYTSRFIPGGINHFPGERRTLSFSRSLRVELFGKSDMSAAPMLSRCLSNFRRVCVSRSLRTVLFGKSDMSATPMLSLFVEVSARLFLVTILTLFWLEPLDRSQSRLWVLTRVCPVGRGNAELLKRFGTEQSFGPCCTVHLKSSQFRRPTVDRTNSCKNPYR